MFKGVAGLAFHLKNCNRHALHADEFGSAGSSALLFAGSKALLPDGYLIFS